MSETRNWRGPYASADVALDELRRSVAQIIGADPETWPEHGNAPLAIAAAIGLREGALKGQHKTAAARDVLAERARQISAEGYAPEHDDEHVNEEIAAMAAFYAMPDGARDWPATETGYGETFGEAIQPEGWEGKTGDRRGELVKAGALILAEIERLDRAAAQAKEQS